MRSSVGKGLRIGLSACFFHADPNRPIFKGKTLHYLEQSMARWVQASGALVYLIPSPAPGMPVDLSHYAADLDGLVLQGGSDLSPTSYGETPLRPEWAGDRVRDDYERALVQEFNRLGKPILGVCRGLQLLNVAFGGTLLQDIGTQRPEARIHRDAALYDRNLHELTLEPGSRLTQWYGGLSSARINSIHHQGVKDLGKGCVVEARCPEDGMIEAFRVEGEKSWIQAVQWHPEFHAVQERAEDLDPTLLSGEPLLAAFLSEAHRVRSLISSPRSLP